MFGERHNALLLPSKPSAKTIQWSGSPRFWLIPPQKKKDKRTVNPLPTNIARSKVYIQQNPSEVPEGLYELGIDSPNGARPQARRFTAIARRRSRNSTRNPNHHSRGFHPYMNIFVFKYLSLYHWQTLNDVFFPLIFNSTFGFENWVRWSNVKVTVATPLFTETSTEVALYFCPFHEGMSFTSETVYWFVALSSMKVIVTLLS